MNKCELQSFIKIAIKACKNSITTDWLAYCISQSVEIDFLDIKIVTEQRSIKNGIPAINTFKIIDNDFYNNQNELFKQNFKILNQPEFTVCIEKVIDIQIANQEYVNIIKKQTFFKLANPS
jgi:hypothetical protein